MGHSFATHTSKVNSGLARLVRVALHANNGTLYIPPSRYRLISDTHPRRWNDVEQYNTGKAATSRRIRRGRGGRGCHCGWRVYSARPHEQARAHEQWQRSRSRGGGNWLRGMRSRHAQLGAAHANAHAVRTARFAKQLPTQPKRQRRSNK